MDPERPRFKRRVITYNPGLTETYCQGCNQFLGAGRSEAHLRLLESAHSKCCRFAHQETKKNIKGKG
jgi:hypothetical protein